MTAERKRGDVEIETWAWQILFRFCKQSMPSPFDKSIEEKCVVQFVRRSAMHVLHIPCMHIRMSWICQQKLLLWSRLQSWARLLQTHVEAWSFTTNVIDLIVYPFDDDGDGWVWCFVDPKLHAKYMKIRNKSRTNLIHNSVFFLSFQMYFFSPTIVDEKKREKTRQFSAENGNRFRWFGKFDVLSARVKVEIMHREVELFRIELNGSGCACTLWDVVHWGCTKENWVVQFHWYDHDHSISGLMELSIKHMKKKAWCYEWNVNAYPFEIDSFSLAPFAILRKHSYHISASVCRPECVHWRWSQLAIWESELID